MSSMIILSLVIAACFVMPGSAQDKYLYQGDFQCDNIDHNSHYFSNYQDCLDSCRRESESYIYAEWDGRDGATAGSCVCHTADSCSPQSKPGVQLWKWSNVVGKK